MLIGAHVSNAGGLPKAVERGVERGCEAIQIFNQSPRMWRPTAYSDDDFAEFREAIKPTKIKAVLIHAVYLLNCATEDREMRDKSRTSLIQSLRVGAGIRAVGVVLHPGSAKQGDVGKAIKRAGKVIKVTEPAGHAHEPAATASGSAWIRATCWRRAMRFAPSKACATR